MLKLKLQYFSDLMWRTKSLVLSHQKSLWCRERLKAGGEGDDRGWHDCMAPPTQWTWVWANSRSWWQTGRPGVLWSMGWQRVGHDWATEQWWDKKLHWALSNLKDTKEESESLESGPLLACLPDCNWSLLRCILSMCFHLLRKSVLLLFITVVEQMPRPGKLKAGLGESF